MENLTMFMKRNSALSCLVTNSFQVRAASKGYVGPTDPVSNLRTYKYELPANASPLERRLMEERKAVYEWNHEFWKNHNTDFIKQKSEFIADKLKTKPDNSTLDADEMSIFYKHFLDNNWRKHVVYNFKWYKKNVNLSLLHLRVKLANITGRSSRN